MKFLINNWKSWHYLIPVLVTAMTGCFPESENGELGPKPTAAFEVEAVAGKVNTYLLKSTSEGAFLYFWDKGDGFAEGSATDTVYFPDRGEYEVKLLAVGSGGTTTSEPKTIVVETSDPVAGNLVVGGRMEGSGTDAWTTMVITDGVTFGISDGKMVATGGGWGHAAFYQTIEVQANKNYRFAAVVSGNGATDTWFEVYFGKDTPVPYQDYTSGGNRLGLNTWAGCGNSAFSGNLTTVGCVGDLVASKGVVSFAEAGTIYLLVKTGGSYLGDGGIAIDNIEFRGVQ